MYIKIYPIIKNAGQSGRAGAGHWRLQVMGNRGSKPNSIIGWSGGNDTLSQVDLHFPDKETAINAAKKLGLPYHVVPKIEERNIEPKNYAENFSYRRSEPWTH